MASHQTSPPPFGKMEPPDIANELRAIAKEAGSPEKDCLAFVCAVIAIADELRSLRPDIPEEDLAIVHRGIGELYGMVFHGQKREIFASRSRGSGRRNHPLLDVARGACLVSVELLSGGDRTKRKKAAQDTERFARGLKVRRKARLVSKTILRWRRDPTAYKKAHAYYKKILEIARATMMEEGATRQQVEAVIRQLFEPSRLWSFWNGPRPIQDLFQAD